MILYNTLMGVAAGLALILVPRLMRKLYLRQRVSPEGWSLTFAILGFIMALLGGLMATTWPLTANPPINIAFAEPVFVLGLLSLAAAFFLWRKRDTIIALSEQKAGGAAEVEVRQTLTPISWIVLALGLMLTAITLAILRFELVGGAPPEEPITGLLYDKPWIENTFFAILYGLSAVGALLTPWAVRNFGGKAARIVGICWTIAGILFLLFSAMNYYTHIGMLINFAEGDKYQW
ncbi:MAG TPA: DUF981 family protein [Candidatus Saccharimonadales bacterium]|nr:DUF981 family protein [Candidatus Saccharimonadales bacterium]